ncbi:RNA polymerase sigma factor [candidate division KSB1 bacterium]|nr:RNA polymerase sigma factor [candidate division KSB1 bacterium]
MLIDHTDQEQMMAVRDGDLDALGPLFEKYNKALYHHFLMQTGHTQISEDLVQEVFFRILKYRHTYRGESKFSTWLYSIGHNVKMDYYRKKKMKTVALDNANRVASKDPEPDTQTEKNNEAHLVHQALQRLSEDKREVLILSRFQNMKYEEIAEVTGCAVGTIKARVHHALKALSTIYLELSGESAS